MVPSSRTCPAVFAGRCEHQNAALAGPALTRARCAAQGLSVPGRGRGHAAHDAGAPGPLRVQPGRGRPRRGALGILGADLAWIGVHMSQVVWTKCWFVASLRAGQTRAQPQRLVSLRPHPRPLRHSPAQINNGGERGAGRTIALRHLGPWPGPARRAPGGGARLGRALGGAHKLLKASNVTNRSHWIPRGGRSIS